MDNIVTGWEAGITFGLTFVFILVAYIVDKMKECREKNQSDDQFGWEKDGAAKNIQKAIKYQPIDFYNTLLPLENGVKQPQTEEEKAKIEEMKQFLKENFETDRIMEI